MNRDKSFVSSSADVHTNKDIDNAMCSLEDVERRFCELTGSEPVLPTAFDFLRRALGIIEDAPPDTEWTVRLRQHRIERMDK